jgi:hypothetical protein
MPPKRIATLTKTGVLPGQPPPNGFRQRLLRELADALRTKLAEGLRTKLAEGLRTKLAEGLRTKLAEGGAC